MAAAFGSVTTEDSRTEEYRELETRLERNRSSLYPTLNEKQKEDLEKMEDIWGDLNRTIECAAFVKGFRLAVQLMAASV